MPKQGSDPSSGERPPAHVGGWWVLAGAGILTQLLTTVSGVLAARMVGVEGRGQVVMVATLGAMASQLTLGGGLPNAVTKLLAERGVTTRDGLRGFVRGWTLWGLLAAAIAGGYMLFLEWDVSGATKYGLAVAVVIMGIQAMASRVLMGAMLGEGTALVHIALTGLLPQAAVVAVVGTALALGISWNPVELLTVTIVCTGVVLLARLRVLARPTGKAEDRLDRGELTRLARRTYIGSVGPIDGLALDRILVGTLLGNVQLGLYSVAFALGGLTSLFGLAVGRVALPRIAVLQKDPRAEVHFVRRLLLFSSALFGVVVLGLQAALEPVIRLTFGADFLDATDCARWMIVASAFLGLRRVMIAVLQGRGRGGFASIVELALTPVMLGGIILAAALESLVAVGITMLAVGIVSCLVLGFRVARSAPAEAAAPVPTADPTM
ncbi:MAG: oligosaccharide flippase family protein [Aeromicrobium sp.]